ncbi:MAG: NADH-quinone oxidoreductase subunit H [Cytophagales bacterium]|nr:NADH-quinone oxidoreductase subunit H [Cytophagales bacterium]MDW8384636.1 complex I subunit 1 family protein [Flammeovirgaceae bacterium]
MTAFLISLGLLLIYILLAGYAERKTAAFIQDRLGPTEMGPKGIFVMIADGLKLIQKEDIIPQKAHRFFFLSAPFIIFMAVFAGFAVVPLTSSIIGSETATGVFYVLAITSLDIIGIFMAGWGANSKFTLYGAMRSVSQIVSYEVPLGLSVLSIVIISQSLNLQEICKQQGILSEQTQYLFGLKFLGIPTNSIGGFLCWNIVRFPLSIFVMLIFFIAGLAESNRAPFDLPESESEIIGGFHTEYSGFRWAVVMLSEYAMMLLVCMLTSILFLGGWNTPLPNIGSWKFAAWTTGTPGTFLGNIWSAFWLISKSFLLIFLQMWIRWTFPRLRVDQLTDLSWKYLTPFALGFVILASVWRVLMII